MKEFKACAALNNTDRLACYDKFMKKLGIQPGGKPAESTTTSTREDATDNWIKHESESEMDDSKTVTLLVKSENTVSGFLENDYRPVLYIRCKENKTEMIFQTKTQFDRSGLYEVKADVRLDKGKAKTQNFSIATNGRSIFFKKPITNIKKMFKASSMKIQWTPFHSNPEIATFNISGLKDAIKPLRETCNW